MDVFGYRLSYSSMSWGWKVWIIYLLIFDSVASLGLFMKRPWGDYAFLLVALSQLIAYAGFSHYFGDQGVLIKFHIITLSIYGIFKLLSLRRFKVLEQQK
ncbi:DUF6163 family protein [Bdellovibrio svalbardensis]|uniref:DUF6163 family protein n=1 Tax=Bdellovibrio svalbardensis TaxID=2972972 RepID=A0ABT6DE85_9BACT|nr:DUF6163 family protein [Bdellovibrio svalbardensis]MDG0815144.1 DUF6163 family protein [Bdellovibrio svalbardensis]